MFTLFGLQPLNGRWILCEHIYYPFNMYVYPQNDYLGINANMPRAQYKHHKGQTVLSDRWSMCSSVLDKHTFYAPNAQRSFTCNSNKLQFTWENKQFNLDKWLARFAYANCSLKIEPFIRCIHDWCAHKWRFTRREDLSHTTSMRCLKWITAPYSLLQEE